MEKKRVVFSRDSSPGVCERIFNAIRVSSPNFRAIRRRVSFSPAAASSAPPNPKPLAKVTPSPGLVKMKTAKKMKIEPVVASEGHHHHHHHEEIPIHRHEEIKREDHHHIENRFTDYINRAKVKMRTGGSDLAELQHTGKHHDDHRFTEFINRARMKLRTSSSMNDGVKGK